MRPGTLGILLAIAGCTDTPPPRPGSGETSCRWAHSPPLLDGRSEEDEWRGSRLLWDRDHLYFLTPVDAVLRLDPYEFRVDALGNRTGRISSDPAVSIPFDAAVDQGTVEGRIPWSRFLPTGGRPDPGETRHSVRFVGESESPRTRRFRPFGIERRIPLTTSRVVGSPDPPPPYRAVPAYPRFKKPFLIALEPIPGTDLFLLIHQDASYGTCRLLRLRDHPDADAAEPLLDLKGIAFGLTFHPRFRENGFFYVHWNDRGPAGKGISRVVRYTMNRTHDVDPASAAVVLEWSSYGHNGGGLAFGSDGMLYVTTGDGTSDSDTELSGQDASNLRAKLLRLDVDRPDPGRGYSIPRDNPFVDLPAVRPETWAYGFRNPWRLAIEGDQIWVGNNGQDAFEQIYRVRRGANYGWSVMEGAAPFYPNRKAGPTPLSPPTIDHPHSEARSLTGGIVITGTSLPDLRGAYVYGDYSTGKIWGARHDGERLTWHAKLAETTLQITAFSRDSRGELLVLDHQGAIYRLEPRPASAAPSPFPRTLSESGLFASVKGHRVHPSLIPYSVNSPLWSDGAHKERFLALPGDSTLGYTSRRSWNFPDGAVLVKSFALEGRWVETRFLTRQEGQWVGYSYAWNDEQTEAALVAAEGAERDVGARRWRFPSRTECMVCHTRAANFVLGFTEAQLNRSHDYGGIVDNQLRTLEHLGVFRVDYAAASREGLPKDEAKRARPTASSSLLVTAPARLSSIADPYDASRDLTERARSYLHANCSGCHVEAGGGNAQIDLDYFTKPDSMKAIGVPPLHDSFGLPDARIIAPGAPERSVLLHRLSCRGRGQMPPLATKYVDEAAVRLLRDWIASLK